MENIYLNESYLRANPTWHEEDSSWKALQIEKILRRKQLQLKTITEVGCGVGGILVNLHDLLDHQIEFMGYDISIRAIERAKLKESKRLRFKACDVFDSSEIFDLLLIIDVIEHVPDYLGFIQKCREKANYKIYHIPLDIHVSSALRGSITKGRKSVGHLHYFTAESALETLQDTGHQIIDFFYTKGSLELSQHSLKRKLANLPRRVTSIFSDRLAARLFGGFSLLVLAK